MSSSSSSSSSGIGFAGLLTILFIGLKLTNHIDWSWLWVLSPLWIGFAIVACIAVISLLVTGFFAGLVALLNRSRKPKRPFR
jgi:hypothetical protein